MMPVVSRRYLVLALLAVAALAGPRLAALQQVPRTVGAPGGEPHTVDFLAVTKDDKQTPVLDLTKETVTLKVGGKNRVITSLQLVKLEGPPVAVAAAPAATAPAATPAAAPLPPPFGTNVVAKSSGPGRSVYFVIDTESLRSGDEGPVKTAILGFLGKLSVNDQVGLVALPHGGLSVELTSDVAKLRSAITGLTGAAPATEKAEQAMNRSRLDLEQLTGILRSMRGTEHPSTIIYIGSSLMGPGSPQNVKSTGAGADARSPTVSEGELTANTFNSVRENVAGAQTQIFVVQSEGGAAISGATGSTNQGLMDLAGIGGGDFFGHLALGNNEDALARIGRATSSYYVATFDADPSDKPNTRYALSVSTSRADVRVWARPDFEHTKAATNTTVPSIDAMFKTSDPFRDLPMRAVAYSVRPVGPDKDKTTWVRTVAEVLAPGTKLTAASAGIYDYTGHLVFRTSVSSSELAKPILVAMLQATPGKYRIRFAATDGKTSGAVDYPVEVGLTPSGPFKLSSIVLGVVQGGFVPKFQFKDEPEAIVYFELYGGAQGVQITRSCELAASLTGPALKDLELKVAGSGSATETDKYIFTASVPLADLPAGDYIVRASVGAEGKPVGTVSATLRKVK